MESVDVVVVGAGIAGMSCAAALAARVSVAVVEMEATPGHHATGRSAALYLPTYGPASVRRLTAASADFFRSANDGRSPTPLVSPRAVMYVADEAHHPHLRDLAVSLGRAGGSLELVGPDECRRRCPALRPDWIVAGGVDHDAMDVDVAATMATFRSTLVDRGGQLRTGHRVTAIERSGTGWNVTTSAGSFTCGIVVDAAGAWVDRVAELAGVAPLGFEPRRRTMGLGPIAADADAGDHFVAHATMDFYFQAEHGELMFSPADETPSEPADAQPEEIDVARAIERINTATSLGVRSVRRAWAGLRTFSPDGGLVLGPDPREPGFVWCAGQGGYGIHTSAAAAAATARLALHEALPDELLARGLTEEQLSPARLVERRATPST